MEISEEERRDVLGILRKQEQSEYSYPDFRSFISGYTYTYDYEAQLYILKEED